MTRRSCRGTSNGSPISGLTLLGAMPVADEAPPTDLTDGSANAALRRAGRAPAERTCFAARARNPVLREPRGVRRGARRGPLLLSPHARGRGGGGVVRPSHPVRVQAPGTIGEQFAEALIARAKAGVPSGSSWTREDRRPSAARARSTTGSPPRGRRCASTARSGRACLRAARSRRRRGAGTSAGSATSTTARCSSSTAESAGSAARNRGSLPGRALPRPVPPGRRARRQPAPARVPRQLPVAGRRGPLGGSTGSSPCSRPGPRPCPRSCCTTPRALPADHRRDRGLLSTATRLARRRQPIRDRPQDDRPPRGSRAPRRPRPPVRPRARQQLGVRTAQQFHHRALLSSGVQILGYPAMLHAKAFVRDGVDVLAGTCNLEAWSLKRFFEIDLRIQSRSSPPSSTSGSAFRPKPFRHPAAG